MANTYYYRTKKYIKIAQLLLTLLVIPFHVFDHYADYFRTSIGVNHQHSEFTFLPGTSSQCVYLIPFFFVCVLCVIGLVYDHILVAFVLVIVGFEGFATVTCVPLMWQANRFVQLLILFLIIIDFWLSYDLYAIWKERNKLKAQRDNDDTVIYKI